MEEGQEWDHVKNKDINPRDVKNKLQDTRYHFTCRTCKHPLYASPDSARECVCQFCNSGQVCGKDNCKDCFDKSYASAPNGSLVLYEQNITPIQINKLGHYTKYTFKCNKCEHDFQSYPESACNGICIYCGYNAILLCPNKENCDHCKSKTFASLEQFKLDQWIHPVEPIKVLRTYDRSILFHCNKFDKDFKVNACKLNMGRWCPYCCVRKNSCADLDFGSLEWDEERNGRLETSVRGWSNDKWYFKCSICLNSCFKKPEGAQRGCSCCSENMKCDNVECILCIKKTYANVPENSLELLDRDPRTISQQSAKFKCNFRCKKCNHSFLTTPQKAYSGKCGFCNHGRLCEKLNCDTCHNKSFASFDESKVKFWSKKNLKKPRDYSMFSKYEVSFDCNKCGETFERTVHQITSSKMWCPCLRNFSVKVTELMLFFDKSNIKYDPEHLIIDRMKMDFIVTIGNSNKFFIEYDGEQHFILKVLMGISRTKDKEEGLRRFKKQRNRDLAKDEYVRNNNELLFRFSYRNNKSISELVTEMLKINESGARGVVILDDIEDYWTTN